MNIREYYVNIDLYGLHLYNTSLYHYISVSLSRCGLIWSLAKAEESWVAKADQKQNLGHQRRADQWTVKRPVIFILSERIQNHSTIPNLGPIVLSHTYSFYHFDQCWSKLAGQTGGFWIGLDNLCKTCPIVGTFFWSIQYTHVLAHHSETKLNDFAFFPSSQVADQSMKPAILTYDDSCLFEER